jgi:hypothetical protein
MRFSTQSLLWCAVITQTVVIVVLVGMVIPNERAKATAAVESIMAERKASSRVERTTSGSPTALTSQKEKGRRYFQPSTDPSWLKAAAKLTPADAKEMLARNTLEIVNLDERAEKAWNIIGQLCQNGYPHEAWALIEEDTGAVRQKQLNAFFREADLPKEELLRLLADQQTHDRAIGLYGYWGRFSAEEFSRMDMSEFPLKSQQEIGAFRKLMSDMFAEKYDPADPEASRTVRADLLSRVVDQANAGMFSYEEIAKLMTRDPSKDGFLYWEATEKVAAELKAGQNTFYGTDAEIIRLMTAQNPEKVLNLAVTPGSREQRFYHIALTEWLDKDYKKGEDWYYARESAMTEDAKERSAVAFVRASVRAGNYGAADQWLARVKAEGWHNALVYEKSLIEADKRKAQGQ